MIFKVAVCDDDKKDVQKIKKFLHSYEMEYNIDFDISVFLSSKLLLEQYREPGTYHILFLDVEMPDTNGLELARQIRNLPDKLVKIIFVSNYPEYMQDSFNVQAFQYFPKPLQYEKFKELMHSIQKDFEDSQITKLLIEEDGVEELVYVDDIILIQSGNAKKKQLLVTLAKHTVETHGLLTDWERDLQQYAFISPCRGYLVNLNHIHYIKNNELILSNNLTVPLSRRREKEIRDLFSKRLLTINQIR